MKLAQEQRAEEGDRTRGKQGQVSGLAIGSRLVPADPDDPRVTRALEEYLAALEEGQQLDRQEFLDRHSEIMEPLAKCLDGLEFIRVIAPQLHDSAPQSAGAILDSPAAEYAVSPLGDFHIVGEIGRGGMGVVYEAIQLSLGRRVALKVLPFAAALDPKQLQRFKNEAHAAAQLHHTNIVPVFGVGCERGVHYYAMQYIDGHTLAQVIQELRELAGCGAAAACVSRPEKTSGRETQAAGAATVPRLAGTTLLSATGPTFFRTVAQLGVQAALALEHAHQLGIVHRDIKPANLLLDVRGHLWITDFGLAHCQSQGGLTMSGDLVGTLRYMSPEQALAKRLLIDHRTDIYSLGVTLYELLTLEPAFSGSDREELLQQVGFQEPPAPRQRNQAIPRELEIIVLKAMEKYAEGRYPSAQEFADDLRRFLEDKPIHATRPTLTQRAAKWSRRHPAVVWAAMLLLAVTLVASGVATLLIARERDLNRANYERAQANLDRAYRILDEIYMDTVEKRLPREKELTAEDRQFLGKVLTLYEEFAKENSREPQGRLKNAEAYRRVGSIYGELGQAEQAAAAYQQALAVSSKLATEFPNDPTYRRILAQSYSSLGTDASILVRGRTPELEQAYAEALRLQEQLVQEFPTNLEYLHDLGWTYFRLGYMRLFGGAGPPAEAETPVRRALEIRENLVAACPSAFPYRKALAMSLGNLENLLKLTGRLQEADKLMHRELEVRQQLVDDFPAQPDARLSLGDAYRDLASLRSCTGRMQEAVEALRQALNIHTKVAAEFPNMLPCQETVARGQLMLGDTLRSMGAEGEAMAAYQEAIADCQKIIHSHPECAEAYLYWGFALARTGAGKEATAVWEQAVQHAGDKARVVNSVARSLATSLDLRMQHAEAAVQLAQKAVGMEPQNGSFWNTLGIARYRAEQWKEAISALEKAQQLRSGGDSSDWFFLAMAQWQLGERGTAREWYGRGVQWMDKNKPWWPFDEELCRFRAEAAALLASR